MITRNVVRDHFNRRRPDIALGGSEFLQRIAQLPDEALYEEADTPLPELVEVELMRRAVQVLRDQLSEQAWRIFWETSIRGRTSSDVAWELDATPAAVRRSKARSMHQLRQLLAGLAPSDNGSLV